MSKSIIESTQGYISWVICRDESGFLNSLHLWRDGWELAFQRKLPNSFLRRYFLESPSGFPIIILGFNKGRVVASSTLVPLYLVCPLTLHREYYFQYISAYILPGYSEGFLTYKAMLGLIRNELVNSKFKFILSFPNENAKPLMTRLGGFSLVDVGFFIRGRFDSRISKLFSLELCKPFFDSNLLSWRKHEGILLEFGGLFKIYQGEKNLLDVVSKDYEGDFEGLLPWWSSWGNSIYQSVDNYRLNMCIYSRGDIPNIKRSFLLSDVF